jgi:hypothetical protein
MPISEEERERRSKLAKELNNRGDFGGAGMGQGRKKKQTANEKAALEAARNGQKIVDAILHTLENGKTGEKLKAAALWLEIEAREVERNDKKKQHELDVASKDDLIKYIVGQMAQLKQQGIEVPNFDIDGSAVEVKPKEIEK